MKRWQNSYLKHASVFLPCTNQRQILKLFYVLPDGTLVKMTADSRIWSQVEFGLSTSYKFFVLEHWFRERPPLFTFHREISLIRVLSWQDTVENDELKLFTARLTKSRFSRRRLSYRYVCAHARRRYTIGASIRIQSCIISWLTFRRPEAPFINRHQPHCHWNVSVVQEYVLFTFFQKSAVLHRPCIELS